jgi:hypothetical protein
MFNYFTKKYNFLFSTQTPTNKGKLMPLNPLEYKYDTVPLNATIEINLINIKELNFDEKK